MKPGVCVMHCAQVLGPLAEKLANMSPEDRAAFSWDDPPVPVSDRHLN